MQTFSRYLGRFLLTALAVAILFAIPALIVGAFSMVPYCAACGAISGMALETLASLKNLGRE